MLVLLNVIGFGLLALAVAFLVFYNRLFHPVNLQAVEISSADMGAALTWIGLLVLVMLAMVVLHEAVHGVFFWVNTDRAPRVGVGVGYAYAAAPEFFLPRGRYVWVGLAPAVILTLLGLALVPFVSGAFLLCVNIFIALNFSGAVADFWVVAALLRKPVSTCVRDFGDRIEVYEPE